MYARSIRVGGTEVQWTWGLTHVWLGTVALLQGDADEASLRADAARIVTDYRVYVLTIPKARGVMVADIELGAADRNPGAAALGVVMLGAVVVAAPSLWYWTVPPNAPLPLGVASGLATDADGDASTDAGALAAGAEAAGAALPVAPAQPATRSVPKTAPRIVRMLIPPIGFLPCRRHGVEEFQSPPSSTLTVRPRRSRPAPDRR